MRRFILPLLCLAALCGCRSTVAPLVTLPDAAVLEPVQVDKARSPQAAPELSHFTSETVGGSLVLSAKLKLNGFTPDQLDNPQYVPGQPGGLWYLSCAIYRADGPGYVAATIDVAKNRVVVTIPLADVGGDPAGLSGYYFGVSAFAWSPDPICPDCDPLYTYFLPNEYRGQIGTPHGHAPSGPQIAVE